jgi:hypothetical protein
MIRLPNPVIHVLRLRLHLREPRYQEFEVRSLVNLLFIDHGEVSINPQTKLQFPLPCDGATSLTTAYVVQNRSDNVTISYLQEYFATYRLNPKYIVADQAFMGTEVEDYYSKCPTDLSRTRYTMAKQG